MMKRFLWCCWLCLPLSAMAMLTPDEMIAQGRESFGDGQYKTAVAYYTRAAEHGNRTAQLQLSQWYFSSKAIVPDLRLGQFWLSEAVKPRAIAMSDLVGITYNASFYQSTMDADLALAWLQLGAKQGDARASYWLLCWYAGVLNPNELVGLVFEWLAELNKV